MNFRFRRTSLNYRVGLSILVLLAFTGCSAGYNLQSPFAGNSPELIKQVQSHEQAIQVIAKAVKELQDVINPKKVDK